MSAVYHAGGRIDLDAVIERRLERARALRDRPDLQQVEMSICADDPVHFVREWAWTYDPREKAAFRPFVPVPRQVEFLRWIQGREAVQRPGAVPKSRSTGATYCCAAYAVHGLLFRRGFAAAFGSHKLEYVDHAADPKSIFWKVRDILYNLPPWMMPAGYSRKRNDVEARINNPANGSSITGEGGDNMGRGGRSTIYFWDETAHTERAEVVDTALSMNTRVIIYYSTPFGNANVFAQKVLGGKLGPDGVFWMSWKDNPLLTQEMYDEYGRLFGRARRAQEWDMDFSASVPNLVVPPEWARAAVDLLPRETFAEWPVESGLDVGEEHDLCVFFPRAGAVAFNPESWTGCNTTESAWRARDLALYEGAGVVRYDAGAIGSGIKGPFTTYDGELPFKAVPVMFGGEPTNTVYEVDRVRGKKLTGKQLFKNLRAEMYWNLRKRFERAYEYKVKGVDHPLEDLISIPDHPELLAELGTVTYRHLENGKILLDPKEDLPKSPDHADALALAFAPVGGREFWIR